MPIINSWTSPDTGGNTYFEPMYANFATANQIPQMLIAFAGQSSREGIGGAFRVPLNYTTGAGIRFDLVTTATGNKLVFDFEFKAVGATEAVGTTAMSTAPTVDVSLAGVVARDRLQASMALSATDFLAGDLVQYRFLRDGANTSDTYAGTVWLAGLYFHYSDS